MIKQKLKPCPFCGGLVHLFPEVKTNEPFIICTVCHSFFQNINLDKLIYTFNLRQREKAKWVYKNYNTFECSNCGCWTEDPFQSYCSQCGCLMEE